MYWNKKRDKIIKKSASWIVIWNVLKLFILKQTTVWKERWITTYDVLKL